MQVITLSDISTGDGLRIDESTYTCVKKTNIRTEYSWPVQGKGLNREEPYLIKFTYYFVSSQIEKEM